jgi:beta-phosphoglucomutase-like phosphatase (HAD superfamily)
MLPLIFPTFHAVIFDLDGVLADSEPWWNEIDTKYHRNVLGVSYRIAVEFYKNAFHIRASAEELMRRRGEIATDFFANRVGLFPSARTTLERLVEMKVPLAIATSSVSASAHPFLDRPELKTYSTPLLPEMKLNGASHIPTFISEHRRNSEFPLRPAW